MQVGTEDGEHIGDNVVEMVKPHDDKKAETQVEGTIMGCPRNYVLQINYQLSTSNL